MKLPKSISTFLPKKKQHSDYLLALLLRDEKASAVIVEQILGKIKIIGQHHEYFSTSLEEITEEELLNVLDKTISKAEETLPPNIETKRTVFGVKDEWVDEKKIKKEYLTRLKKVSEELDLQPIGFLVVSEAVAHLIQEEEGAPLSAIVAEIGMRSVNLVLFRGGKNIDAKSGPIEDSAMQTVDSLLKHFTIEVLPSRIIIFNGKEDNSLTQKFITHQWSKSLPFLHLPQISVLPENFDARSIVYGAATQMGLEILGEDIDKSSSEIKTYEHGELTTVKSALSDDEEKIPEKKTDLPSTSSEKTTELDDQTPPPLKGDNFGFVTDEDIEKIRPKQLHHEEVATENETSHHYRPNNDDDNENRADQAEKKSPLTFLQTTLYPLINPLKRLPQILKRIGVPKFLIKGNKILLFPIIFIILLIGLFILYSSMVRATITLNLIPKVVEQTETVTFSPDVVNDFSKGTIQAAAITSTLEGSVSTPTTGKKDVGEKAKGTVTLYNNNDSKKTLAAGTVITSTNNLDYVLDKEVSIASESGDVFSGTKPGTAQAAITAKNIGQEYNLPSNTKFTVNNNSNIAAKNDSAFSGGSKKQVTVVSKKDLDKLVAELPNALKDKATDDLKNKVEQDESLLPDFTDITVSSKKYDKEVDAEAKTVTLKGKVIFEALTYKKKDLDDFASTIVKNNYSQELRISDKGVTTEVKEATKKDDTSIELSVGIKANLLPTLETETIRKQLTGKSKTEAEDLLSKLPQVSTSTISLSPPIPFIPQILPRVTDHITVEVKTNE